ncbi:hypothetical protein NT6N_18390 [Oceaniferula spumae]|uniref:Uncharacterized protein n=1 Tax=Oceaniferula spumae TaxID=2979115 RepID=A0AAT9FLH3_9BACT
MNKNQIKQLANQVSSTTTDTLSEGLTAIRKRPVTSSLFGLVCFCAGVLLATSCAKKGPAEKAGEKVDEAGEEIKDATN